MYVLDRFLVGPKACTYLSAETSLLEYELVGGITPEEYEQRMDAGWRKFGHLLFRPVCEACSACRPIRIPVSEFKPSRSQRRAWKDNLHREVRIGPPKVDAERLALYQRYHEAQGERKGWSVEDISAKDYAFSFVKNPIPAAEITVWEDGRLLAVTHLDLTPRTVSAVYHFYAPELRADGLGTYSILQAIEFACRTERPFLYLGYYVAGCASMEYKAKYEPHELLRDGEWRRDA
jgi:arginine-tRNA-protein transferase